ncbi:MAG: ABC transporter ATP-binding protein, partial [Flavobacteriaceae bacterium]|nr:ABC transporter ATP-binding protein [Flavobacteriaceae bacterium]
IKIKKTAEKKELQLNRAQEKELKKLKNKLSKIESEIAGIENEVANIDLALANDYEGTSNEKDFFENYNAKKKKVDALMEDWELVEEQVSSFA